MTSMTYNVEQKKPDTKNTCCRFFPFIYIVMCHFTEISSKKCVHRPPRLCEQYSALTQTQMLQPLHTQTISLWGRKNIFPSILLGSWLRLPCNKRQIIRRKTKFNNRYTFCTHERHPGKLRTQKTAKATALNTIFSGRQKKILGVGESVMGIYQGEHSNKGKVVKQI